MKNTLPIFLFFVIFFTDFLTTRLGLLPEAFIYFPEAFYGVIAVIALARILAIKEINLPIKYIITFMFFVYVVVAGIIINDIALITIFSGMRTYFKFVPLFLLPLAYNYSIEDIKKQFLVLMILGLIQVPIVLWQTFILKVDGDSITGTLNISNSLSIIMVSFVISILALYLRKKISLGSFMILSIILFLPTTLNETKITPILLIIGFCALLYVMRKDVTFKQITIFATSGVFLLVIFVATYNALYSVEGANNTFVENMSSDRLLKSYNFTGYKADPNVVFDLETNVVGEIKDVPTHNSHTGRVDSVLIPLDVLFNNDIVRFFLGLGINNVHSSGGKGAYLHIYTFKVDQTTIAQLLWETGFLGALLFVIFMSFVARDAFVLASKDNDWRAFSSGWFAITIVFISVLVYTNLFAFDELICLFMYFSSVIVVKRYLFQKSETIETITKRQEI